MKLENQAISLEIAKKLKELGVKQESLFYYEQIVVDKWKLKYGKYTVEIPHSDFISAFTVAELGEMLPKNYCSISSNEVGWSVGLADELKNEQKIPLQHDKNEANARGKMLVYLIENKCLELKK